jgi:hypothetical protein
VGAGVLGRHAAGLGANRDDDRRSVSGGVVSAAQEPTELALFDVEADPVDGGDAATLALVRVVEPLDVDAARSITLERGRAQEGTAQANRGKSAHGSFADGNAFTARGPIASSTRRPSSPTVRLKRAPRCRRISIDRIRRAAVYKCVTRSTPCQRGAEAPVKVARRVSEAPTLLWTNPAGGTAYDYRFQSGATRIRLPSGQAACIHSLDRQLRVIRDCIHVNRS